MVLAHKSRQYLSVNGTLGVLGRVDMETPRCHSKADELGAVGVLRLQCNWLTLDIDGSQPVMIHGLIAVAESNLADLGQG